MYFVKLLKFFFIFLAVGLTAALMVYFLTAPDNNSASSLKPLSQANIKETLYFEAQATSTLKAETEARKRLVAIDVFKEEAANFKAKAVPYGLPLDLKNVRNYEAFLAAIPLSPTALEMLEKNGFVITALPKDLAELKIAVPYTHRLSSPQDDFAALDYAMRNEGVPLFITSDTLLHYYRLFWKSVEVRIERDILYERLRELSQDILEEARAGYYQASDATLKEAYRRNMAYAAVALKLLEPKPEQVVNDDLLLKEYCADTTEEDYCWLIVQSVKKEYPQKPSLKYFSADEAKKYAFTVPSLVQREVEREIKLIEEHQGLAYSPLFYYQEDYANYVPFGHYLSSEKLKNYFLALTWYERMKFLRQGTDKIKPGKSDCGNDGLISAKDAKVQSLQALLLAAKVNSERDFQLKWEQIYKFNSFFRHYQNELGPIEYGRVLADKFSDSFSTAKELALKYDELRPQLWLLDWTPEQVDSFGGCRIINAVKPATSSDTVSLDVVAGFRLFGLDINQERYLLNQLSGDAVGRFSDKGGLKPLSFWEDGDKGQRGWPRLLDLAGLVGSQTAADILKSEGEFNYVFLSDVFAQLRASFKAAGFDFWLDSLNNSWLFLAERFLAATPEGYPTFMRGEWPKKQLNTFLASWVQNQQDVSFEVRQASNLLAASAAAESTSTTSTLIILEPLPDFYGRLAVMNETLGQALKDLFGPEVLDQSRVSIAFNEFTGIWQRLKLIAQKELQNQKLDDKESSLLADLSGLMENVINLVAGGEADAQTFQVEGTISLANNQQSSKTMQEGAGYLKVLVVVYKLPNQEVLLFAGPVNSYYEFKQSLDNPLNQPLWQEMLKNQPPASPLWMQSISQY